MLKKDSLYPCTNGKQDPCVSQSNRPSRFLLDLPTVLSERQRAESDRLIEKTLGGRYVKYKGEIISSASKAKIFLFGQKDRLNAQVQPDYNTSSNWPTEKTEANGNSADKMKRLAIFPVITLAVKLAVRLLKTIYGVGFMLGWLLVFAMRFVWLLGVKLFGYIFRTGWRDRTGVIDNQTEFCGEIAASEPEKGIPETQSAGLQPDHSPKEPSIVAGVTALQGSEIPEIYPLIPGFSPLKSALYFAVLLLLIISPFKALTFYSDFSNWRGQVLGTGEAAVDDMLSAARQATAKDFDLARQNFTSASANFTKARDDVATVSGFLGLVAAVIPQKDIRLGAESDKILAAGNLAALLGKELVGAYEQLAETKDWDIKKVVDDFSGHIDQSSRYADELSLIIKGIDAASLPSGYQEDFSALKNRSDAVSKSLNELSALFSGLKVFLGFEYDRRYLLVFQNNAELRGSGGFLGSFAVVDFSSGAIKNIEAPGGGSYDTEAGLHERIAAPEPLWLVNPLWHFWDANWWPDWPTTARKLEWFYEKSDGPTVDGVISLTPTVMEDILEVIGPISLGEPYNFELNSENFWPVIQALAEQKSDITTKPKMIIGDTLAVIMEELPKRLDKDMVLRLLAVIEENLAEKQALFYFNDPGLEELVTEFGWHGGMENTAWDYLLVANTNIAGQKSDRLIVETINHRAEISYDGTITDTVKVERTHTGKKGESFTGARNVNWLRVYVPLGSELMDADGFTAPDQKYFEKPQPEWKTDPVVAETEGQAAVHEPSGTKIYAENGKTVFANWTMLDPGETKTVYLKYRLPFRILKSAAEEGLKSQISGVVNPPAKELLPYALFAQKQPGSIGSRISSALLVPTNLKIIWEYPAEIYTEDYSWVIDDTLKTDKYWAVLLEAE